MQRRCKHEQPARGGKGREGLLGSVALSSKALLCLQHRLWALHEHYHIMSRFDLEHATETIVVARSRGELTFTTINTQEHISILNSEGSFYILYINIPFEFSRASQRSYLLRVFFDGCNAERRILAILTLELSFFFFVDFFFPADDACAVSAGF